MNKGGPFNLLLSLMMSMLMSLHSAKLKAKKIDIQEYIWFLDY